MNMMGRFQQEHINKIIQQIRNWAKQRRGTGFIRLQEGFEGGCFGLAQAFVNDPEFSEDGCIEGAGPDMWFADEFTWEEICTGGILFDSKGVEWDMEILYYMLAEFPDGSNLCDCISNPESCDPIYGCMDSAAFNYNPEATQDDGSCINTISGCTDPEASNYNEEATTDNNSCEYPLWGCTDPTALNYNENALYDNNSCSYESDISDIVDCSIFDNLSPYNQQKFCIMKCSSEGGTQDQSYWFDQYDPILSGPYEELSLNVEYCSCCKGTIDRVEDGDKEMWICGADTYPNISAFCLPIDDTTTSPFDIDDDPTNNIPLSQSNITIFDTQEECVNNTLCKKGTYGGPNEWFLSLPWPSLSEERSKQLKSKGKILIEALQRRAGIIK